MTPRILRAAAVATALFLAGCALPAAAETTADTRALVADRVGVAPTWHASADDAAGTAPRILSERDAIDVALRRSRHLQALLARAAAETNEARADAAFPNPMLDLGVRWPHGGGGPIVDAGLVASLVDILRLPARRDAAALATRGAALDAAAGIVDAITEVRVAWVEAVAAEERVALETDVAESAAIAADLAARQFAAGTLAALDAHRHRVFAEEEAVALERSRVAAAAARERLVRALGVFGDEARIAVPAALPPLPESAARPGDLERVAVARRLDLERARVAVIAARLAAGIADDERLLPDAELGGSFERESDGARSSGPSIGIELPLSERGAAHAAAADAAVREAEANLYDLAVRVRSEVRESAAALDGAHAVVRRFDETILPLRAAGVEEAQLHYNGMLIGVYDLLDEKRDELRARRDAVDARRELRLARIALDAALGGNPAPEDGAVPAAAKPATTTPQHHDHGAQHGAER